MWVEAPPLPPLGKGGERARIFEEREGGSWPRGLES